MLYPGPESFECVSGVYVILHFWTKFCIKIAKLYSKRNFIKLECYGGSIRNHCNCIILRKGLHTIIFSRIFGKWFCYFLPLTFASNIRAQNLILYQIKFQTLELGMSKTMFSKNSDEK